MSELPEVRSTEPVSLKHYRKLAVENVLRWVQGADWDQFWGDELAGAAWANDELAAVLTRAKRELAERIMRIKL